MAKPKNNPASRKKKSLKQSEDSANSGAQLESSTQAQAPESLPEIPVKPRPLLFKISLIAFISWLIYLAYIAYVVLA